VRDGGGHQGKQAESGSDGDEDLHAEFYGAADNWQ
jgi:hypothetical protein